MTTSKCSDSVHCLRKGRASCSRSWTFYNIPWRLGAAQFDAKVWRKEALSPACCRCCVERSPPRKMVWKALASFLVIPALFFPGLLALPSLLYPLEESILSFNERGAQLI